MAIPLLSTYNFKATALGASDMYLAYYNDKSEEPGKGTLHLYFYPSLVLCKSIVFPKISQLGLIQGYLLAITSTFQVFSLPELDLM